MLIIYGRYTFARKITAYKADFCSSACSGKPENVLVRVERLRKQAEEFQRTVEEELRTTVGSQNLGTPFD